VIRTSNGQKYRVYPVVSARFLSVFLGLSIFVINIHFLHFVLIEYG